MDYTRCTFLTFARLLCCLGALTLMSTPLLAQPKSYSPASRIGLGQLKPYELVVNQAMGGISTAYHDNIYTNPKNPAALGWTRLTTLDLGMFAENNHIDARDGEFDYWTGNISHLMLTFPIFNPVNDALNRKERDYAWGMMIGLQPFSEVGYDIRTEVMDPDFGRVIRQYTGTGGAYSVMWSNGWRYKNFNLGLKAEYIFGDLREDRIIRFEEETNSYQNIFRDDQAIGALRWTVGSQYKWDLKNAVKSDGSKGEVLKSITLGATVTSNANLRVSESSFYRSQHRNYQGVVDTLLLEDDVVTRGLLPGSYSLGLLFKSHRKWIVGADIEYAQWSKYENEARPADLMDTYRLSAGMGFTPKHDDIDSYLSRMTYRLGFNYGTDPRVISGSQMVDYRLSAGFTLPFIGPRRTSFGNFAFNYGERFIPNGISESYFSISFGFTAADNQWFVKSKYN